MREIIAEILGWKYSLDKLRKADQILTLISEEIKKVENPYIPIRSGTSDADRANTFESCRQKILAQLK